MSASPRARCEPAAEAQASRGRRRVPGAQVMLMIRGGADVVIDGEVVARLGTANGRKPFVGELEFFSHRPNVASVVVRQHGTTFLVWRRAELAKLGVACPSVALALHKALARDLEAKLLRAE